MKTVRTLVAAAVLGAMTAAPAAAGVLLGIWPEQHQIGVYLVRGTGEAGQPAAVPVPASLALLGLGLAGLGWSRRKPD